MSKLFEQGYPNGDIKQQDSYKEFKQIMYEQNKYCDIVSVHCYGNEAAGVQTNNERRHWIDRCENIYEYNGNSLCGDYNDYSDQQTNFSYLEGVTEAVRDMNKLLYIGEFGEQTIQLINGEIVYSPKDPELKETRAVLEQIRKNQIPFSSLWAWQDYRFNVYNETSFRKEDGKWKGQGFCFEPVYVHSLIDDVLYTNEVLGNPKWEPQSPDVIAPTAIISYWKDGTVWTKASDNNRVIDRVELYINSSLINTSNIFPYRNDLDLSSLGEGTYTVEVWVYDESGNIGKDTIEINIGEDGKLRSDKQTVESEIINSDSEKECNSFIFPNPTRGEVYINSTSSNVEVEICNSFGIVLYQTTVSGYEKMIQLPHSLPSGLYFVNILEDSCYSSYSILLEQ